ncbi:UBA/THIF-type NAD/FAD binding protein [Pseudopedobacter saltans DSM 12145]|uniref:Molybdopterin-synthase adenylyltransferase n=1 Tax=Pseudopedobacter saltans (strain ATCC 51119 / DSM 12145 / JCM 21818 / CCUG 39354 / LMG 10337 / NBRC 100064 / NCIMB 13643) TaxID=762903 RepID=F0SEQ5_PSESL|nr:HesA/MoeB/ThiF family protein [Pseudopedobacter saltans]ADY51945.1 UBA/THIF-type NAD/FAD binding protein [Pseudopedobacter saltans DSM 12145]
MNRKELERYSRQIILDEFGLEGQQKLKAAKVLFIGAGGLGCPAMQYLVAAGIGEIGIVDFDHVSLSNLHRQILFTSDDINKLKAEVAAEKLKVLNPHTSFKVYTFKVIEENIADIIGGYDLVVDGSDNFKTRYLINDACVALGKTWVFGSLFKYEGQLSVFNYQQGPTYRDLYPELPEEGAMPNCSEIGVIGVLPGIIGNLMANEVIKIVSGKGEVLTGKLLVYNAMVTQFDVFSFGKKLLKNINLPSKKNQIVEIDKKEIEKSNHPYYLIDVREEWEFEDFNKGGINIPLSHIPEKLDSLSGINNIVCCCSYGGKSRIAAKLIKDKFPEKIVYNIKDGIEEN